jgi:chorismate dehydratase
MALVRIGAVSYLNARPLVEGLEARSDRFTIRYDLPSTCATLLHAHEIDLGLIPSIEYLRGEGYSIVPDCAVVSDGPVASVAIFTSLPIERVRTIALDTSSRTSVALTQVIAVRHFGIDPSFVDHGPDLEAMMTRADAALLIGDPALFAEHERLGLQKIDLGATWRELTGLPFVYACWTGFPGALDASGVAALQAARTAGEKATDGVAARFFPDDPIKAARAAEYLRENIRYRLGDRERAGLERFYELAASVGVVQTVQPLRWYGSKEL